MEILALTISKERAYMFVAEHFMSDIIQEHGKNSASTDVENGILKHVSS